MDGYALRAANMLVGNDWDTAALEFGLAGPSLEVIESCLIAATGFGIELHARDRVMPTWTTLFVRCGWMIQLKCNGGWGYLAVGGGISWPTILGSRSMYVRGGLGRPLTSGETLMAPSLSAATKARSPLELAGRHIPESKRPAYNDHPTVEVILGPQKDRFSKEGIEVFLSSEYAVSPVSDRMGYRLDGRAIAHRSGADIISDGLVPGSVQVPASGQPIVMMSDCPPTGGYTKIATVVSADLPLLAQCPIGSGRISFRATTVEAAQERYRAILSGLRASVE